MAAHHADAFRDLDGCAVVTIAGRNPDTGRKLAKRHDVPLTTNWTEAVQRSDVDAVVVCTHNESHAEIALAAIRSGKHVLTEYPIARSIEQGDRLREALRESGKVLRVTHEPDFSKAQSAVHDRIAALGDLITAIFVRLTPGRGRRPEVLFNHEVSGPPALFFVGHIYPLIDLFGPAAWVEGAAEYVGLDAQNRYERFANSVTVGFQRGGLAGSRLGKRRSSSESSSRAGHLSETARIGRFRPLTALARSIPPVKTNHRCKSSFCST